MITLFYHPASNNARKVHWLLEELGLAHEKKVIDLFSGEQKMPQILAMNPNGKLPILQDGDLIIWESNAILSYLAQAYGSGRFWPTSIVEAAPLQQWLFWQSTTLDPAVFAPWLSNIMAQYGAPFDAEEHKKACQKALAPLAILNKALEGREYLLGGSFGLADLALSETSMLCKEAGISTSEFGNIEAWLAHISVREAFSKSHPSQ